jgi:hypothetical protein
MTGNVKKGYEATKALAQMCQSTGSGFRSLNFYLKNPVKCLEKLNFL